MYSPLEPRKPDVEPADFFALDLRVGRIVEAEEFPAARRPSYRVAADFGPGVGRLETVAQITQYSLEELRGRLVVGAINLGTKRIAGFESQFLILGAMTEDGKAHLLALEGDVPPGAPIA